MTSARSKVALLSSFKKQLRRGKSFSTETTDAKHGREGWPGLPSHKPCHALHRLAHIRDIKSSIPFKEHQQQTLVTFRAPSAAEGPKGQTYMETHGRLAICGLRGVAQHIGHLAGRLKGKRLPDPANLLSHRLPPLDFNFLRQPSLSSASEKPQTQKTFSAVIFPHLPATGGLKPSIIHPDQGHMTIQDRVPDSPPTRTDKFLTAHPHTELIALLGSTSCAKKNRLPLSFASTVAKSMGRNKAGKYFAEPGRQYLERN